jgi:hypothetical protein
MCALVTKKDRAGSREEYGEERVYLPQPQKSYEFTITWVGGLRSRVGIRRFL